MSVWLVLALCAFTMVVTALAAYQLGYKNGHLDTRLERSQMLRDHMDLIDRAKEQISGVHPISRGPQPGG